LKKLAIDCACHTRDARFHAHDIPEAFEVVQVRQERAKAPSLQLP